MLAARITLPHFSVSSAISLPKSGGEPDNAVPPRSTRRALILGSARPALISLLSSPRTSSSASSGVISLMSWRNWCMRLTSRKKRSAIVVVLFHDFAFDVAIFLGSYIIDERADFLGRLESQVP